MNRRCELPPELLEAFLDGDLSGRERRRVETHLSHCATCKAVVAEENRLRRDFSALPELPCPDAVTQRILAATSRAEAAESARDIRGARDGMRSPRAPAGRPESSGRHRGWLVSPWLAGPVAAALIAVLFGVGLLKNDTGPAEPDVAGTGVEHAAPATGDAEDPAGSDLPAHIVIGDGAGRSADAAADEAKLGLVVAGRIIAHTRGEALADAFGKKLTSVLQESLAIALDRQPGGRG
jgi:hypothetical protein